MQPVNQIASDVTRKHGKKQHDKSDDLSTVHPNLSSIVEVHFFYSKSWPTLSAWPKNPIWAKHDESHSVNELTKSHISAWQTQVSKRRNRKKNSAFTSLFSFQVWISDTFKNNWHLRCILRQQVKTNALRCSQSNRVLQEVLTRGAERNQNWSQIQCDT